METFKKLDLNNDGVLSKEELREGLKKTKLYMPHEELDKLISQIDSNKNDKIDYSEFIAMTINKQQALSDDRIKDVFKMFDENRDGHIHLKEFQCMLQGTQKMDDKIWKEMLTEAIGDPNKEELSFEEFKNLLKSMNK